MLSGMLGREYCMKCSRLNSFLDCYSSTRYFCVRAIKPVNHYASLGLTPKATQIEIKSAYYKLSKLYHPDINSESEENATRFRQITSAYEILGNLKLRKLYDKGLLPRDNMPSEEFSEMAEETSKFHKTSKAKRTQPTTGRTSTYNFDEWSRFHYGTTINRRTAAKMRKEEYEKLQEEQRTEIHSEYVLFVTLFICTALILYSGPDDGLDKPKTDD